MQDLTAEWVHKAEADFAAAQRAMDPEDEYPGLSATLEMAEAALAAAARVRAFVRGRLGLDAAPPTPAQSAP